MLKSIRGTKKYRGRGRPKTTGSGEQIQVRMQSPLLAALDAWIKDQPAPKPTRPDAIRQLLEIALSHTKRREPSPDAAKKASKLASKTAEGLLDSAIPTEEQQRRKRRLIRGPSEFREIRKDQEFRGLRRK